MKLEDYLNELPQPTTIPYPEPIDVEAELSKIIADSQVIDYDGMATELKQQSTAIEIPPYLLDDPEAVGYPSEEFQQEIYDWVLQYIPSFTIKTVKDFGCGRGDFGKNFFPNYYTGIDHNKIIVDTGQKKYPTFNLIHDDYLKCTIQTDYTVCIGTLNTFVGIEKWDWFERTLEVALNTTNDAIVFVLSKNTEMEGFLDYPISEIIGRIPSELPFKVDYTKFEDIYALVVYKQPYT